MHLLVIRLSAIGDVALTVPVIEAINQQHPEIEITVLSQGFLKPLFHPLQVNFETADIHGLQRGPRGLRKLYQELQAGYNFDAVLDLHAVLRTHILSSFFKASGTPVYQIDKGRKGKKQLTRKRNKVRNPQQHSSQRYADVFRKAGVSLRYDEKDPPLPDYQSKEARKLFKEIGNPKSAIGVAPLASFPGKAWPLTKVEKLIAELKSSGHTILLFGGPQDSESLEKLRNNSSRVYNLAGRLNFEAEIALMKSLKAMIAMDSGNMHLATLAGIPVVSIWGATHPDAGFYPLGKNQKYIAQFPVEDLKCRPCSVFGKKPCFREDYACLNWLSVAAVLEKVNLAIEDS